MKLRLPDEIDHFEFDTVEYYPDEIREVEIQHPDHIQKALMHGCTVPYSGVSEDVPSKTAPEDVPADAPGTDMASDAADSSGDTSPSTGDTDEPVALPDFDSMGRDELVTWLNENGASVPGNVSKDVARQAVADFLAVKNA